MGSAERERLFVSTEVGFGGLVGTGEGDFGRDDCVESVVLTFTGCVGGQAAGAEFGGQCGDSVFVRSGGTAWGVEASKPMFCMIAVFQSIHIDA